MAGPCDNQWASKLPICQVVNAPEKIANSALQALVDALAEGTHFVVSAGVANWMRIPSPNVLAVAAGSATPGDSPALARPLEVMWGALGLLTAFFFVISLIFVSVRMVLRNSGGEGAVGVGRLLFNLISVTSFGAVMIWVGIRGSDLYSDWILAEASRGAVTPANGNYFETVFAVERLTQFGLLPLLLLSPLIGLCSLGMAALMLLRSVLIMILVAAWPTVAAASGTEAGNQAMKKTLSWLVAFILFKPAAATVYGLGVALLGGSASGKDVATQLMETIGGALLLALAVLALPALIKFMAPPAGLGASSAFSGGAVLGAAATGAAMVGGLIATGGASGAASGGGAMARTGGPAATSEGSAATGTDPSSAPGPRSGGQGGGGGAVSSTTVDGGPSGGGAGGGQSTSGSDGGDGPAGRDAGTPPPSAADAAPPPADASPPATSANASGPTPGRGGGAGAPGANRAGSAGDAASVIAQATGSGERVINDEGTGDE